MSACGWGATAPSPPIKNSPSDHNHPPDDTRHRGIHPCFQRDATYLLARRRWARCAGLKSAPQWKAEGSPTSRHSAVSAAAPGNHATPGLLLDPPKSNAGRWPWRCACMVSLLPPSRLSGGYVSRCGLEWFVSGGKSTTTQLLSTNSRFLEDPAIVVEIRRPWSPRSLWPSTEGR